MEQGSLRCDVNVSLSPAGSGVWGTRSETKNVNSLRSVERAIRFEMGRQADVLDRGGRVVQETRHFHEDNGRTTPGRSKEEATDYRYFPEPDLVPVAPDPRLGGPAADHAARAAGRAPGPAGRRARRHRLRDGVDGQRRRGRAGRGHRRGRRARGGGAQLVARIPDAEGERGRASSRPTCAISPEQVARVVALVEDGTLSVGLARQAVDGVLETGADVDTVVAERGLRRVSDVDALAAAVDEAIAAQPDVAEKIRGGKVAAAGALVGAVMKATRGQADAKTVRELILQKLS